MDHPFDCEIIQRFCDERRETRRTRPHADRRLTDGSVRPSQKRSSGIRPPRRFDDDTNTRETTDDRGNHRSQSSKQLNDMNKPKTEEEIRLLDGQVGITGTNIYMCADGSIKCTESWSLTFGSLDSWIGSIPSLWEEASITLLSIVQGDPLRLERWVERRVSGLFPLNNHLRSRGYRNPIPYRPMGHRPT